MARFIGSVQGNGRDNAKALMDLLYTLLWAHGEVPRERSA